MTACFKKVKADIQALADPARAALLQGYFKTGKGCYGEGDIFLGLTVPQVRKIALAHCREASLSDIEELLASRAHEHRLAALEMLVFQYEHAASRGERKKIASFYVKEAKKKRNSRTGINNWDLVDLSASYILGEWLWEKHHGEVGETPLLTKLSRSKNIWERRIAIVSTAAFIRRGSLGETFRLACALFPDTHDLIHKAAGWMLREAGKKEPNSLRSFLKRHSSAMPRTMLRYAIEKFDPAERKALLSL